MATATGLVLGITDILIRLTPLDGSGFHWHAVLIAFVIMPSIIAALSARLRDGIAPLIAALALSLSHGVGMLATDWLLHGRIWDDIFSIPLMTLPVLVIVGTLARLYVRRKSASTASSSTVTGSVRAKHRPRVSPGVAASRRERA